MIVHYNHNKTPSRLPILLSCPVLICLSSVPASVMATYPYPRDPSSWNLSHQASLCGGSQKMNTLSWNYPNLYQKYPQQYYNHHGHHRSAYHHQTPNDHRPNTYQQGDPYIHHHHHNIDDQVSYSQHKTVQTNLDSSLIMMKKTKLNISREQEDNVGVLSQNSEKLTELEELGKEMQLLIRY